MVYIYIHIYIYIKYNLFTKKFFFENIPASVLSSTHFSFKLQRPVMQIPLLASDTTDNDNKRKLSCIISKKNLRVSSI